MWVNSPKILIFLNVCKNCARNIQRIIEITLFENAYTEFDVFHWTVKRIGWLFCNFVQYF